MKSDGYTSPLAIPINWFQSIGGASINNSSLLPSIRAAFAFRPCFFFRLSKIGAFLRAGSFAYVFGGLDRVLG